MFLDDFRWKMKENHDVFTFSRGSTNIIAQFGAAQRGAVFVWRWQHVLDAGPYKMPDWLVTWRKREKRRKASLFLNIFP